jgi:hypothetical protein
VSFAISRPCDHAIDERAVAAVHAVEVADRQRTTGPGRAAKSRA